MERADSIDFVTLSPGRDIPETLTTSRRNLRRPRGVADLQLTQISKTGTALPVTVCQASFCSIFSAEMSVAGILPFAQKRTENVVDELGFEISLLLG